MGAHALFDVSIERLADIKRMYALGERVQASQEVRQTWATYIKVR